jgi:regulatory protein
MELDRDLSLEASVCKGNRITHKEALKLWEEDNRRAAMSRALHFLSYRNRTIEEVRRKLFSVGFDVDTVATTVAKLERIGYLDDEAFAEQFAQYRLSNKAHGPQRIRMDLRRLGVSQRVIEEKVATTAGASRVAEAAMRAGSKYWARAARETDVRKRRWKFVQYLVRRGFSLDVAHRVFDAVSVEAESE